MKITKFGHSCIYVEAVDSTALFDPGVFYKLPIDDISKLDHLFITHEHPDHYDAEVVVVLVQKFPDATITAPQGVVGDLSPRGVVASTTPPEGTALFASPHEYIEPFGAKTPEQIGVHFHNVFSHPGDSHSFTETMPVLFLPISGPWGTVVRATELALELQPKVVIPIHDWFLSEEAKAWTYARLTEVFAEHRIQFAGLAPGESISLTDLDLL